MMLPSRSTEAEASKATWSGAEPFEGDSTKVACGGCKEEQGGKLPQGTASSVGSGPQPGKGGGGAGPPRNLNPRVLMGSVMSTCPSSLESAASSHAKVLGFPRNEKPR